MDGSDRPEDIDCIYPFERPRLVKNGIWTITMSYYKQFMNC